MIIKSQLEKWTCRYAIIATCKINEAYWWCVLHSDDNLGECMLRHCEFNIVWPNSSRHDCAIMVVDKVRGRACFRREIERRDRELQRLGPRFRRSAGIGADRAAPTNPGSIHGE